MLIVTNIPPRKDGTVRLTLGEQSWVFEPAADGRLVADVNGEDVLRQLLSTGGTYEPANEEDFDEADRIVGDVVGEDSEGDEGDDESEGDEGDEENPGGAPVEANTPPKAAAGTKPQRRRRAL